MHHVVTTPEADLNDPLATQLHTALPATHTAATVVPALLGFRPIFGHDLAQHEVFTALVLHWYRTLETDGPEGLGKEINHG
jgi:fructuronate reductase